MIVRFLTAGLAHAFLLVGLRFVAARNDCTSTFRAVSSFRPYC